MSTPSHEPTRVAAGDTWTWTRTLTGYPSAEGWTVAYFARAVVGALQTEPADVTAEGATYTVIIPAGRTGVLSAGTYRLAGYATRAGERYEIYAGVLTVSPNFASADAPPSLGTDEELLQILDAAVKGRLTDDIAETYTIDGVAVAKIPLRDLTRLLGEVRQRVRASRSRRQTRTIKVRYGQR